MQPAQGHSWPWQQSGWGTARGQHLSTWNVGQRLRSKRVGSEGGARPRASVVPWHWAGMAVRALEPPSPRPEM